MWFSKLNSFVINKDLDLKTDFLFTFKNFGVNLNPDFVHGDIAQFRHGGKGQIFFLNFF